MRRFIPRALRNRAFARLFGAYVLTDFASTVMFVVLPLIAFERSGSGQAFALVMLGGSVGRLVALPVGGVLVDRFDRRRIMLAGDAAMLAVVALVVTSVSLEWWVLLALAQFTQNVTGALTGRAAPAMRRDIVDDEHRVQANALIQLTSSLGMLIGPVLGAALYATTGFGTIVAIQVAALVGSLVLVLGLRHPNTKAQRSADDIDASRATNFLTTSIRTTGRDLRGGARAMRADPYLRATFASAPVSGAANALFLVALVPWLSETLHRPASLVGAVFATLGGGAVIGGLVITRLGERLDMSRLMIASCLGSGLAPLVFLGTPQTWLVLAAMALLGFAESGWWVSSSTVQQRRVPSHLQGRVPALSSFASQVASFLAIAAAGFTIDRYDPSWTMSAAVIGFALIVPLGLLAARAAHSPAILIQAAADAADAHAATPVRATTTDADLAVSG